MLVYTAAIFLAAIAGFALTAIATGVNFGTARETAGDGAPKSEGGHGLHKLIRHAEPKPVPGFTFADEAGQPKTLSDFKGKVVLLNFWATWCAPCKVEMPALDALQAKLGGDQFQVVALSIDRTGPAKPRAFLDGAKLSNLALYIDEKGESAVKVQASGLPVTLMLDREGREVARLVGPADWAAPEAVALVRSFIEAAPSGQTAG